MNIEKYKRIIGDGKLIQSGEHFPVLDMFAWLNFHTESSAGFSVGAVSGSTYTTRGHFDIHHPCPGHIKTRMRCSVPEQCMTFDLLQEAVDQILAALSIPPDETYEADFTSASGGIHLDRHVDRDGMTDRIVTRKRT